ncbi:hypothetical protein SUDANB105_01453 [Streptomyces sp. enrichment culture]
MIDAGAVAEAAEVDLFDRRQIEEYTAELVEWTGGIDVAVVAIRGEDGDAAQLTAVRTVAERMAAQGSGIIVIMSISDYERDYHELIEHAADHGVAVLPLFCAPARGQRHSISIDRPAHS